MRLYRTTLPQYSTSLAHAQTTSLLLFQPIPPLAYNSLTVMCISYSMHSASSTWGPASNILLPASYILQPAGFMLGHFELCLCASRLCLGLLDLQIGRFRSYLGDAHLCLRPLSLYLRALDEVGSLGDGLLQAV